MGRIRSLSRLPPARDGTAWHGAAQHQRVMGWLGTAQSGMAELVVGWLGTLHRGVAWHGVAQHGTVWHGTARPGTAFLLTPTPGQVPNSSPSPPPARPAPGGAVGCLRPAWFPPSPDRGGVPAAGTGPSRPLLTVLDDGDVDGGRAGDHGETPLLRHLAAVTAAAAAPGKGAGGLKPRPRTTQVTVARGGFPPRYWSAP